MRQQSAQNNIKLKKRSEFLGTYKGRALRREFFTLYWISNEFKRYRYGVTVPKTTGTAVIRNKFKRWAREAFRKRQDSGEEGRDIHIFIGSKRKSKDDYRKLSARDFKQEVELAINEAIRS